MSRGIRAGFDLARGVPAIVVAGTGVVAASFVVEGMTACCHDSFYVLYPGVTGDMDLELLRRFVAGECDAGERAQVERWLASDASRRQLVEAVRRMSAEPGAMAQRFDSRAAWSRVSRAAFGSRERVVRVRSPGHVISIGRGGTRWSKRRLAAWAIRSE